MKYVSVVSLYEYSYSYRYNTSSSLRRHILQALETLSASAVWNLLTLFQYPSRSRVIAFYRLLVVICLYVLSTEAITAMFQAC